MTRIIAATLLALLAQGASAQNCPEIRFQPGASSGEVSGLADQANLSCFIFSTGAGQTARLQLFAEEPSTCFTIPDVVDCRDDYSFRTARRSYQVNVFPLYRLSPSGPYRLRLTIR